jgi:hypothetical protein
MQYYIHNEPVTPREVTRTAPEGYDYTNNVLTYQGVEYDIIWNDVGDGYILIDGKKRYLEEQ